ncbi:MAG: N-carbamoylputrescine amidase [Treponema sp. GWB1_62_6]|nr:MAG: N-carbamoylputrescine amidase [Treponema sp. GWB1_62_6]OHE67843.1 MAG: N-carbamoylputrescine amidase [Treponema sp. GWC1_61_84]HCM27306.1 N-carbamoylputrescine amidase [Treponema sp.]
MRKATVAAVQFSCTADRGANLAKAEAFVRRAAAAGANIVLLQELFETPYFCQKEKPEFFDLATEAAANPAILRFREVARELGVVLPISFFEKSGPARYNSVAVIDADGEVLGIYRKSHIPDGPGYEEKYYFNPGDLGAKVWKTRYGTIGVGICWDQWFPELARAMVLKGAELLFYPTAIGSEPQDSSIDSMEHWRTVQRGHAGANLVPVIVCNRVGTEKIDDSSITFYGSSFIADGRGALVQSADRGSETILVHSFDLDGLETTRSAWGIFRDRRPDVYGALLSLDGNIRHVGARGGE